MLLNSSVIEGFVRSCLVKDFDGSLETPQFHRELWELFTSKDRFVAVSAPRGHAKSTAGTISYGLASLLFQGCRHLLIVSNTEDQAAAFVQEIRNTMCDNDFVKSSFDLKLKQNGEVDFITDSQTEVVGQFNNGAKFRIIAKGSGQRMRGMLWKGTRPDLVICDDLEDDEICMNKDRREKFRNWFMNALLPAISGGGKVRIVGTILHMDSLLERLMPVGNAKTTVVEPLKMYSTKKCAGNWVSVKYRAHDDSFEHILWPAKHSRQDLEDIRNFYVSQGNPSGYAQEYLNIPIDDSTAHFKRSDFLPMRKEDFEKHKNYYITVDLAIAESERADYSAFVVGGVDENNLLHVVHTIKERMDGREIVDTILQLQRLYDPVAFGIEDMQISKSIGPFLRESMQKHNVYPSIIPLKPHKTDKIARSRSIQARLRAGAVRFDKEADWYLDFENEMCQFPRSKHDDLVDCMSYLGLMLDQFVQGLSKEEEIEEQDEDNAREYEEQEYGRSDITGY